VRTIRPFLSGVDEGVLGLQKGPAIIGLHFDGSSNRAVSKT
jgi:hypothetical protein